MGGSNSAATGTTNTATAYKDEIDEAAQYATGSLETDLSTRLELHVSAMQLRKKINGFCIVYVKRTSETKWHVSGKTEILAESANPNWIQTIFLDFNFEVQAKVRIEVYNVTAPQRLDDLKAQDFVGSCETFMAILVNSQGRRWTRNLEHFQKANNGQIFVYCEELTRLKHNISFAIHGMRLLPTDFWGRKPCPYALICRANKDIQPRKALGNAPRRVGSDDRVPIYRTEEVKKQLNPIFKQIEISVQQLCKGEEERPIIIEVYDSHRTQTDKFMGYAETSYADLYRAHQDQKPLLLQLTDPEKDMKCRKKKKINKRPTVGCLQIQDVSVISKYSFLDYVNGGLDIELLVALDYTRSNGDPRSKESLHYHDTTEANEYVSAIRAVGEILEHYDSDKRYPVYGFGAKIPPSRTITSHLFSLKGDFFDPEVSGISGILDAYRDALAAVTLHGPTLFHEVVEHAGKMAAQYSNPSPVDSQKYFILLIVTDGVINDMQETINAIVKCTRYPMSIIIVGVGDEDFSLMDELDADITPLYSTEEHKFMERDIVQFVPFAKFKDRSYLELARCTLDEIPREVVNYFTTRNNAPRTASDQGLPEEDSEGYDIPIFLKAQKLTMIDAAVSSGYPRTDVEAAFESGVPANDINLLIDILSHRRDGVQGKCEIFKRAMEEEAQLDIGHQGSSGSRLVRSQTCGNWSSSKTQNKLPGSVPEGDETKKVRERRNSFTSDLLGDSLGSATGAKLKKKKGAKSGKPHDEDFDDIAGMCKVCFERTIDTVILECGHQVVCEECSVDIGMLCPLCRQTITRIIRTYNP
eukprot:GEMP01002827.1.p1 GENE.GEMP01002827.1~~GEMP01002827.1.p1  ORF type:complete len:811 (+),score=120.74 GEMP01002827.1:73-2505(+)